MSDPFAHLKENRWREVAEIDHRFERGEIDDGQWHRPKKPGMEYRILWFDA